MASDLASLDTSIILRLILNDDPTTRHQLTSFLLQHDTKFLLDDFVIGETIHVLEREEFTRPDIVNILQALLSNSLFISNLDFLTPVFNFYLTHPKLSFNDCYLAAKSSTHHATPLYTLDRKLAAQSPFATVPPLA